MKKFLLILGLQMGCITSAQLLSINTLQNLSASPIQNLDDKLADHFNLLRHHDIEENTVRVYSNKHIDTDKMVVLTVFIKDSGCHVFSVVSHYEDEILKLKTELVKNNFEIGTLTGEDEIPVIKYDKEKHRFLIKEPNEKIPGHQVVFMCRE